MYKIWITKSAQKQIKDLPKNEISAIVQRIKLLSQTPRPLQSKKLIGSISNYRLRKGDYRILYSINDGLKEITIYKVSHRKNAYR